MYRLLAAIAALLFVASATYADAPVTLDNYSQSRLDDGERASVLVWLVTQSALVAQDRSIGTENEALGFREQTDEIILRAFGVPAARLAEANSMDDLPHIAREFRYTPVVAMELTQAEIERLAQDPGVRRIETDSLSRPLLSQSVPLIGADTLHTGGNTGVGTGVAILDTGVDHEHPMFTGRITGSACFSRTAGNSTSLCPGGAASDTTTAGAGDNCEEHSDNPAGADGCFHGTHVAGIAVGGSFSDPSNPSTTLLGVAPGAGIIAVQVFSRFVDSQACGSSTPCVLSYTSDQLAALEWLFDNRQSLNLAAINMSLGGGENTTACPSNNRASIITQLRNAGVATVIASGNNGFSDAVNAPGCIPDAITVGSTTISDSLSSFSNSSPLVDMVAPGSDIRSANTTVNDSGTGRARLASGTSMATPHVAGAIALLRASHPGASVDAIENALEATGIPITNNNNNVTSPRIRVDLANAQLAAGGNGTVAGVMTVSPVRAFNASGSGSNPTDYGSQDYTLTNTSGASISWQANASADWLLLQTVSTGSAETSDLSSPADTESGNLAAGASVVVRATVNPVGRSSGNYLGTITFTANGQTPGLQIAAALAIGTEPPANDNFADALPLTQATQTASFNSVGASKETGEPNHTSSGGASLWWTWTAPATGQVRIRTQNATFDTMLGVYTGSSVNALSTVAQNDDISFPTNTQSQVEFGATAGTTYAIAVDGFSGATGNAELAVTMLGAPGNDNLASAQSLSGPHGSQIASTVNATRETGESSHGGSGTGASVWFAWQAPSSGDVFFTARGGHNAQLAAYDQNAHGAAAISSGANQLSFAATSGTTYYIALETASGEEGIYGLSWTLGANSEHFLRAAMLPNARAVRVGDTATAFATIINPARFGTELTNCRIERPANFNGGFTFRRTDPASNAPIGNDGDTVNLAAGASQSYVLSATPGVPMNGFAFNPLFICDSGRPADPVTGVTNMSLTATATAGADIISIGVTPSADGILAIPTGTAGAFSVAAINIGATQSVTITPGTGSATLPLTIDVCETNPGTGACISPRQSSVIVTFAANETRTFTIFVRSTGAVAFSPAVNRVIATFTNPANTTVGATSIAVRSP